MQKIKLTISLILALTPILGHTSTEKDFAKCAIITGELERLDCYDKTAKKHKLTPQKFTPRKTKDKGKWVTEKETNPVDDSTTIYLYLAADSGVGKYGDKIVFVARCQSNKTEAYINWKSFLGTDEIKIVTRVDDNKAENSWWGISSDRKAAFRRRPISFLKKMINASKLIAQTTPYGENTITTIFDIGGFENAIQPLREECGW